MSAETLGALLSDLRWPAVILAALILFRGQLREAFGRLTKLSVAAGDFKLETSLQGRVPAEVIEELRRKPDKLGLRGDSRTVTILYLETRGYTGPAELSAERLSEYLHIYLTEVTGVVFELGGTIDRYEGTAVTAYWGAPIPYADSPRRACEAALRMEGLIRELSPQLEAQGFPPLLPLFAITTADVVVGDFGSEQRADYSLLGDFRLVLGALVRLNYNFQTNILITEYTHARLAGAFETRLLGERLRVKGKVEPISVYELLGRAVEEEAPDGPVPETA